MSHEIAGPEARWRLHVARLLRVIASGARIDPDRSPSFVDELDEVYRNPFDDTVQVQNMSAAEISSHLLERLKE